MLRGSGSGLLSVMRGACPGTGRMNTQGDAYGTLRALLALLAVPTALILRILLTS